MITEGTVILSSSQLQQLITTAVAEAITKAPVRQKPATKTHVYGIDGLARLLNCSHPTAQRIKNHLPTTTYSQADRKIAFDADAVLTALNEKGGAK